MSTNGDTREFILERASELASQVGLTGLSIGDLARHLERPKSTVSSHFRSKESLQLAVLQCAAQELIREVVRPAWLLPDGLPRLEQLVLRWLAWDSTGAYPGGCLFVTSAIEFDDQPGPVRDHLVRLYLLWHHLVGSLMNTAIADGTLRPDTDPDQFLHDLHGIMLAYHHSRRLLHDPHAERRAQLAFRGLVERARGGA
jgi:AcrR family transcriptional regulator